VPPPFEWIEIPDGTVTLTDIGGFISKPTTFEVEPFAIAKYPITNAQFQVFVDAPDGYRDPKWWGYSEGAKARKKNQHQPEDTA
jgi:formylglycine-generating enzyme required for sulfatase activity